MKDHPPEPYRLTTPEGDAFEIPVEGSLGLLALGDLGLAAWREKIRRVKQDMAVRTRAHMDNRPDEAKEHGPAQDT